MNWQRILVIAVVLTIVVFLGNMFFPTVMSVIWDFFPNMWNAIRADIEALSGGAA